MSARRLRPKVASLAVCLALPLSAYAGTPGDGPLVGFGQSILNFLSGVLGPIVFGIGLCVAGICLAFGSREGMQKAFYAVIGGALLFSVGTIVDFVSRITH
jgi:type IV secretory pathway VirB2 component (pilin)